MYDSKIISTEKYENYFHDHFNLTSKYLVFFYSIINSYNVKLNEQQKIPCL